MCTAIKLWVVFIFFDDLMECEWLDWRDTSSLAVGCVCCRSHPDILTDFSDQSSERQL